MTKQMKQAAELPVIFCFLHRIKPKGLSRLQTKNAARSGIICFVIQLGLFSMIHCGGNLQNK
jgi:hypothetical protein